MNHTFEFIRFEFLYNFLKILSRFLSIVTMKMHQLLINCNSVKPTKKQKLTENIGGKKQGFMKLN